VIISRFGVSVAVTAMVWNSVWSEFVFDVFACYWMCMPWLGW